MSTIAETGLRPGLKALFWAILILIVLAVAELAAWLVTGYLHGRILILDPARYTVSSGRVDQLSGIYHPVYGWLHRYDTRHKERPRPVDYPADLMAVFGDSFTWGGNVKADQTWPVYLSELTKSNVYNLGEPGWGTGQAYLRFEREFPAIKTKLVGLGLITENISRTVNDYRKFYSFTTVFPLTKPRYVWRDGVPVLEPNPISSAADLDKLEQVSFIERLGQNDYFYQLMVEKGVEIGFPRLQVLFKPAIMSQVFKRLAGGKRYHFDLWNTNPQARQLNLGLIDAFVATARRLGSTPIVLILPQEKEVLYTYLTKADRSQVAKPLNHCHAKGILCFDAVRALAEAAGSEAEIKSWFDVHPTPAGNRKIAQLLREFLAANHLL